MVSSKELRCLAHPPHLPSPPQGRETRSLTYEERLEAAQRRRQDGNQLFKEGQYEEALSKYRCRGQGGEYSAGAGAWGGHKCRNSARTLLPAGLPSLT